MIRYIVVFAVFLIVIGLVFIRLVPFDAQRFHKEAFPAAVGDYPNRNSFTAVRQITTSPEDIITALDGVIVQTPRTTRMAGLPGLELITYQTRSAVFGFPDYTNISIIAPGTVENDGSLLIVRGQARFGVDDLNANEARIKDWLDQLGPLTVDP